FNKELYKFIDDPKKHFAYNMYIAKELAQKLKENNVNCVDTNEKMSKRLQFYKVSKCNNFILNEYHSESDDSFNVTISYKDSVVYSGSVTKINKK
ncbi:MAG: hypothetical protein JXQ66_03140, partial [Campylobacterales bacterium]|nr:hypothetical protein [Campylobacterales bacterium]